MKLKCSRILFLSVMACLATLGYLASRSATTPAARQANVLRQLGACLSHDGTSLPEIGAGFPISNILVTTKNDNLSALNFQRLDANSESIRNVQLDEYLYTIARLILKGTDFEERFSINSRPDEKVITLYMATCDLSAIVPGYANSSCTYIGFYNSIVCRRAYFDEQFAKIDATDRVYSLTISRVDSHVEIGPGTEFTLEKTRNSLKQSLITWVIGHELGHAVKHKSYVIGLDEPLHWNYNYNEREQQADQFIATRVGEEPQLLASTGIHVTIGEIIEQQYRDELRRLYPQMPDKVLHARFMPSVFPLGIRPLPGEMPLLIRATRMRQALLNAGIFKEDYGYFDNLEKNITISPFVKPNNIRIVLLGLLSGAVLTAIAIFWYQLPHRKN